MKDFLSFVFVWSCVALILFAEWLFSLASYLCVHVLLFVLFIPSSWSVSPHTCLLFGFPSFHLVSFVCHNKINHILPLLWHQGSFSCGSSCHQGLSMSSAMQVMWRSVLPRSLVAWFIRGAPTLSSRRAQSQPGSVIGPPRALGAGLIETGSPGEVRGCQRYYTQSCPWWLTLLFYCHWKFLSVLFVQAHKPQRRP